MTQLTAPKKIIDAHTHIFPEKIARKATHAIGAFYDLPMQDEGVCQRLIQSGQSIGVSRYLVCSSATRPGQVASINDFISQACRAYPQFLGFGTLHPYMAGLEYELERMVGLGLRGVKLHPDFQQFHIDDEKAMEMYAAIDAAHLPILFHTGDARYDFSEPERLCRVLDRFPDLTCIAAHFGGYSAWDHVYSYPKSPRLFFDTSSSLFKLPHEKALGLIDHFGAAQFFFGTDFPMWDHAAEYQRFLQLGLDDASRDAILFQNFERVFGQ